MEPMALLHVLWPVLLITVLLCIGGAVIQNPKTNGDTWRMVQDSFAKESIGTIVMIACTFSPGKWWGAAEDGR